MILMWKLELENADKIPCWLLRLQNNQPKKPKNELWIWNIFASPRKKLIEKRMRIARSRADDWPKHPNWMSIEWSRLFHKLFRFWFELICDNKKELMHCPILHPVDRKIRYIIIIILVNKNFKNYCLIIFQQFFSVAIPTSLIYEKFMGFEGKRCT